MTRRWLQRLSNFRAALALLALGILALTMVQISAFEAENWVEHTFQVEDQINIVFGLIRNIETRQGGFLLTADKQDLKTYRDTAAQLSSSFSQLRSLMRDNELQLRRLADVDALIRQQFAQHDAAIIVLHGEHAPLAAMIEQFNGSKAMMNNLQHRFDTMLATENALAAQRKSHAQLLEYIGLGGAAVAFLFALILGWGVVATLEQQIVFLRRREQQLLDFNRNLDHLAEERAAALRVAAKRVEIALAAAKATTYEYLPETDELFVQAESGTINGYRADEIPHLADEMKAMLHPNDVVVAVDTILTAIREGEGYNIEYRMRHKNGSYIWVNDIARVLPAEGAQLLRVIGMVSDITTHKEREARLRMLMNEVNHRTKNILTLVMAIARLSATGDPATFVSRFIDRVHALSNNQDILVRNGWTQVDIRELLQAQLNPFLDSSRKRINLSGENIGLNPVGAQTIAMAIHELVTNATKYGALSNQNGQVEIGWRLTSGADAQPLEFSISWREQGGPAVSEPLRKGFGSTVLTTLARRYLHANASIDFAETGVVWKLICPAKDALSTV